jgi:DNA-binding CsgD family transcriptional regulator
MDLARSFPGGGPELGRALRAAVDRGGPVGVVVLTGAAVDDLLAAGIPVIGGSPPRPPGDPLTAREREVLELMTHGLSNTEIAGHLIIGTGTVKTHVSRIFTKLAVRDRAQAVAAAFRRGLVAPEAALPPRPGPAHGTAAAPTPRARASRAAVSRARSSPSSSAASAAV